MATRRSASERRPGRLILIFLVVVLLLASRSIAGYVIEYQWWKEMAQVPTWISLLLYGTAPVLVTGILAFVVLWVAHARGLKKAGTGLAEQPIYARLATLAALVVGFLIASITVDNWTVVRYFAGSGGPAPDTPWHDPVFGKPLPFYLFELPFYSLLLKIVLFISFASAAVYYLTARAWQIRERLPDWGRAGELDLSELRILGPMESNFLKTLVFIFLGALAVSFYLDRYGLLLEDHGVLVGIDYVSEKVRLPMLWLLAGGSIAAAVLFAFNMRRAALAMALLVIPNAVIPRLVGALYVRPNEISLQKPYIARHIEATRSAYGLNTRAREAKFAAKPESRIDFQRNRLLLENVRLWDWRAFRDTVSQAQPLRPYTYSDIDVDRYILDGQLKQVLIAPRELEITQLGDARASWINRHLTFTHGYGLVMAHASRIQPNGLPELLIQDAPPEIRTPSLKLTRPELYYGEVVHEPVFVNSGQPEFDYPSGSSDVSTKYKGQGGFPISSLGLRFAAAVSRGDWNALLTGALTEGSRMMIRRKVTDRLEGVAGFVSWDADPYLVITDEGRLVWLVDGYMISDAHPYSRRTSIPGVGVVNYIRNSVKATVDAYDGTAKLYVFDETDPLARAYRRLFPGLFLSATDMPADLRRHARAPEILFRTQAEIYRTYHMRDPESFYNKADLWDLATFTSGQAGRPQVVQPTYLVATLPGEEKPEYVLMLPFTPHNKQNLIGMMMARCDGEHMGELVFLQMGTQDIIPGPLQIEAQINQDQIISKDLTLWNSQGSTVLRSQLVVLPIDDTVLYVAPIYIQAQEARMPQLRKVVLAMGNTLVYADNYEQGLAELDAVLRGRPAPTRTAAPGTAQPQTAAPAPSAPATSDQRIETVRNHLRRYRELAAQGKWAEAGRELEAIEALVRK